MMVGAMLRSRALVVGRGPIAEAMAEDLAREGWIVVGRASDEDAKTLDGLLADQPLLVSAAEPGLAAAVLRRATLAKCHATDLDAPLPQALELDEVLRERQLMACVGCRDAARQLGYADERAVALVTTALARRLLTGDFRPHWGVWTPERVLQRTGMAHGIREDLRERGVPLPL